MPPESINTLVAFLLGLIVGALGMLYILPGIIKPGKKQVGPKINRYDAGAHIFIPSEDYKAGTWFDLPESFLEPAKLFAREVLRDPNQLSGAAWSGKGKTFSRGDWEIFNAWMIRRGWIAWNNPKAHTCGIHLTGFGRSQLRKLINPTPPPPRGFYNQIIKNSPDKYIHTKG